MANTGQRADGGQGTDVAKGRGDATNDGSTKSRGSVRRLARRGNEQWKRTALWRCKKSRGRRNRKNAS